MNFQNKCSCGRKIRAQQWKMDKRKKSTTIRENKRDVEEKESNEMSKEIIIIIFLKPVNLNVKKKEI